MEGCDIKSSVMKVMGACSVLLLTGGVALYAATSGAIDVKLDCNIGYSLSPVHVDLGADGVTQPQLSFACYVYDMFKNQIATTNFTAAPSSGRIRRTFYFTPPQYGWHEVFLYVKNGALTLGGWSKHVGITPAFAGLPILHSGDLRGGWNDEALQAFSGLMLDRTNTRMGTSNADRVIADCQTYGVALLMQFESAFRCRV